MQGAIQAEAIELHCWLNFNLGQEICKVKCILLIMQDMTYVKQLEDYEEAVLRKRLEEMPETERERLQTEVEQQRASRQKTP